MSKLSTEVSDSGIQVIDLVLKGNIYGGELVDLLGGSGQSSGELGTSDLLSLKLSSQISKLLVQSIDTVDGGLESFNFESKSLDLSLGGSQSCFKVGDGGLGSLKLG